MTVLVFNMYPGVCLSIVDPHVRRSWPNLFMEEARGPSAVLPAAAAILRI